MQANSISNILNKKSSIDLLDQEIILSYITKKDKTFLYTHPEFELTKRQVKKYKKLLKKRDQNLPIAQIIETKEFYGLNFKVNRHTLIPRPETEMIVDLVLEKTKNINRPIILLDIGTGSGCIPISILQNTDKNITCLATDICPKALRIARQNNHKILPNKKIIWQKSNILKKINLKKHLTDNPCFIVTANLPYLPNDYKNIVSPDLHCEPDIALYSGKDGLEHYRALFFYLNRKNISPDFIILEHDPSQTQNLTKIIQNSFSIYETTTHPDLAGKDRIMVISKQ